jgi:5-methyltetrahydrofolate--homocysteine methyltransferase
MLSAETMKAAFSVIEPLLKKDDTNVRGRIVFATVQGDVHDIGKNIVILLMKNYGFEVLDLGKDVPNEVILQKADENNADIIALSALMTTTMPKMKEFMELMKASGRKYNVLIGGAAVTREFAAGIGAKYSVNAVEAVKTALEMAGELSRRK